MDRRTILCLYVPGFRRQTFKLVPKFQWIPLKKLPWIPRTNTCNVNFVGTFVVQRIPQQANVASCSGFHNCKWIPQNVNGIRNVLHQCIFTCVLHLLPIPAFFQTVSTASVARQYTFSRLCVSEVTSPSTETGCHLLVFWKHNTE